jgi:hypothetical protein
MDVRFTVEATQDTRAVDNVAKDVQRNFQKGQERNDRQIERDQ